MADPAIARRVPRPALAPTAVELAPSAAQAIARTRMPIGALSGCLPDQPGLVGLWIDPAGALAVGWTVGERGGWFAFLGSDASLWEPVLTHLDDSTRTAASPLRASVAARLAGTIQLERPAGTDPRRWELDEDSELRLTDWLSIHVEVGWWTPPVALRESIEDVRRAVEQARQPAARAS